MRCGSSCTGRRSKEDLAQSRQYLTPEEEKALLKSVLLMSSLGHPVRIKYMRSLAFRIALRRSTNRPLKPPGPNWPLAFEKRHGELRERRVKTIDWKRHDSHIYYKVTEWFKVISKVIEHPSILPANLYNMDETGVMLSMLGSVKVLVDKDDIRDYRGAGVRRQMMSVRHVISTRLEGTFPRHVPVPLHFNPNIGAAAFSRSCLPSLAASKMTATSSTPTL